MVWWSISQVPRKTSYFTWRRWNLDRCILHETAIHMLPPCLSLFPPVHPFFTHDYSSASPNIVPSNMAPRLPPWKMHLIRDMIEAEEAECSRLWSSMFAETCGKLEVSTRKFILIYPIRRWWPKYSYSIVSAFARRYRKTYQIGKNPYRD